MYLNWRIDRVSSSVASELTGIGTVESGNGMTTIGHTKPGLVWVPGGKELRYPVLRIHSRRQVCALSQDWALVGQWRCCLYSLPEICVSSLISRNLDSVFAGLFQQSFLPSSLPASSDLMASFTGIWLQHSTTGDITIANRSVQPLRQTMCLCL